MRAIILSIGIAACLAWPAAPVLANDNCALRSQIVMALDTRFGETLQSKGDMSSGEVVETFANLRTGTWTVILSYPSGRSCILGFGRKFEQPIPA
ncbi:hypothetical protein [Maritimibacter sp. DP1N21-5]|uniref:hypothetical protein n=1 Tax=Maritimibacter sp. DP1N21-5 TaxID=2836867 RepID=UPI001C456FCF|nr:hypothetical protein [Maritimibacter sp. DP1N21-5]MBV7408786.1 hypothetical protein [Maritimibacter sp. DP1N21-5]